MRIKATFVALALAVPAFVGCSSAADEPAPSKPVVDEPISYDASEATQHDLGVVVWGAAGDANGMRAIGYDAHGAKIVTVEHRAVIVDATHHYFETMVTNTTEIARARLDGAVGDVDAQGHFDIRLVATETFAPSSHAQSILEHLEKDIESGAAEGTSLVSTQSLAIQADGTELVRPGSCLSQAWACGKSLWHLASPLLPCASVAATTSMVVGCALVGSAAGPGGAIAAAGTCAAPVANTTGINIARCAIGAEQTYNGWSQNRDDISNNCGSAGSACFGGGAATSSFGADLAR